MLWAPTLNPERRKILPTHGTPSSSISHARPDIALICKNHQKFTTKKKRKKKKVKTKWKLVFTHPGIAKAHQWPHENKKTTEFERLEKNYSMEEWLEATAKVDRRTDTSCSNFFCSRSVFGVDEEAPDAIARNFFCNPNSPKLPTVCTQVDHRRCSGTPSSLVQVK